MPRLSAALVIDVDPKGLEALRYGFEADGCKVTTAGDMAAAATQVTEPAAQLAVIVVREPADPALTLARALRAPASGVPIPVLMLGPPAARQEARAIAGVELLPLPAFVRDVLTASKMLIAAQDSGAARGPDETGVTGALSEYGLFFLLRTMIGLGRSGILQVERANRRGEIRFVDGQVTAAQVGSVQGSAALHHLLLWEEAALDLKLRSVVHRGTFHQRSEDLLEEAERFLRDFAHASKGIGPIRTVLVAEAAKVPGDAVPPEVAPVVRLFDGQRVLADVIEDSPFRVFDTIRIVSRLLDVGVLRRQDAPAGEAAAAAPGPPASLQQWLSPTPAPVVRATESPRAAASKTTRPLGGLPVRAPVVAKDQRVGPPTRRRTFRRDKTTAEQDLEVAQAVAAGAPGPRPIVSASTQLRSATPLGVVAMVPGASEVGPSGPAAPPLADARGPAAPETNGGSTHGELRSSGTIDVARPLRERRGAGSNGAGPSVVVDFGTAAPDQAAATAPPAEPAPAAMQAVGTVEGRGPHKPIPVAPAGDSIQLDPALMAELDAIEMANTPATPPPVVTAPAPDQMVSLVSGPSQPAAATEAAAPPAVVSPPAAVVIPLTAGADSPTPPAAPASVAAAAPTPAPLAVSGNGRASAGRRPSSEFNALESDFFAREADLYKQDTPETFDDLDRKRPGGTGEP